ncbi:MAG: cyclic lactone autoinducer peptide [Bacilli bacterium]|nr:cyclic lactone autoinducer peptide [Bacilli bacterium]MBR3049096.1 cyclic lactone autoinducer peptide [Bacilli bacterium]
MKKLAGLFAAVAMLATASASLGCMWWILDEPKANNLFND